MEHSPLFKLPAELRNRIYRLVLVSEPAVQVTKPGPGHPPLLLTIPEVRHQSFSIYYGENEFSIPIPNFDSDLCVKWWAWEQSRSRKHNIKPTTIATGLESPDEHSWSNLLAWSERFHGDCVGHYIGLPSADAGVRDADGILVGCIFQMAYDLQVQPWAVVASLLQKQYRVLVAIDRRWGGNALQ